jgi:hypothetical protein
MTIYYHQVINYRQPISDGAGGVQFLSGSTSSCGGWIATSCDIDTTTTSTSTSTSTTDKFKQYLRSNMTANVYHAAQNLGRTVWFGLLEDIPRSMILLQHTLNSKTIPKFPM